MKCQWRLKYILSIMFNVHAVNDEEECLNLFNVEICMFFISLGLDGCSEWWWETKDGSKYALKPWLQPCHTTFISLWRQCCVTCSWSLSWLPLWYWTTTWANVLIYFLKSGVYDINVLFSIPLLDGSSFLPQTSVCYTGWMH